MKIIALTGLVTVEKIALTLALAGHYQQAGQRVAVIDALLRMRIDPQQVPESIDLVRLHNFDQVVTALDHLEADVVLIATAEQAPPGELRDLVEDLPGVNLHVITLVDDRTCDCFPHLRALLEDDADTVLRLPVTLEEALQQL